MLRNSLRTNSKGSLRQKKRDEGSSRKEHYRGDDPFSENNPTIRYQDVLNNYVSAPFERRREPRSWDDERSNDFPQSIAQQPNCSRSIREFDVSSPNFSRNQSPVENRENGALSPSLVPDSPPPPPSETQVPVPKRGSRAKKTRSPSFGGADAPIDLCDDDDDDDGEAADGNGAAISDKLLHAAAPTQRRYATRQRTSDIPSLPPDKIVARYPKEAEKGKAVTIRFQDYRTLYYGEMLNDTVIDFYLKFLSENADAAKKCHIFSPFFYSKIKGNKNHAEKYDSVSKWTESVDIFEKDYLFIPINEHLHWTLVVICFPGNTIVDPTAVAAVEDTQEDDANLLSPRSSAETVEEPDAGLPENGDVEMDGDARDYANEVDVAKDGELQPGDNESDTRIPDDIPQATERTEDSLGRTSPASRMEDDDESTEPDEVTLAELEREREGDLFRNDGEGPEGNPLEPLGLVDPELPYAGTSVHEGPQGNVLDDICDQKSEEGMETNTEEGMEANTAEKPIADTTTENFVDKETNGNVVESAQNQSEDETEPDAPVPALKKRRSVPRQKKKKTGNRKKRTYEGPRCVMLHLDSLGLKKSHLKTVFQRWLQYEFETKKKKSLEEEGKPGYTFSKEAIMFDPGSKTPSQDNSCDCGIFMLMYIEALLAELSTSWYKLSTKGDLVPYLNTVMAKVGPKKSDETRKAIMQHIRDIGSAGGHITKEELIVPQTPPPVPKPSPTLGMGTRLSRNSTPEKGFDGGKLQEALSQAQRNGVMGKSQRRAINLASLQDSDQSLPTKKHFDSTKLRTKQPAKGVSGRKESGKQPDIADLREKREPLLKKLEDAKRVPSNTLDDIMLTDHERKSYSHSRESHSRKKQKNWSSATLLPEKHLQCGKRRQRSGRGLPRRGDAPWPHPAVVRSSHLVEV
eukprot:Rmarinus@m.14327